MLTSPCQLIRVGHKETPSGHPRNEIRKEKKPPGLLSNDKPTWRRVDTLTRGFQPHASAFFVLFDSLASNLPIAEDTRGCLVAFG
jgi:hypothetical protein